MVHYEVNFIIDPVLSGDEIKSTAKIYETLLSENGCNIVHVNEIGLKQLAYPINKRSSGVYYCVEFTTPNGLIISKLELALRRDERIIRFLTVKLDKYGIKYNEDRRTGKISSYKRREKKKQGDAVAVAEAPVVPAPARVPDVPVAPVEPVVSQEEE